MTTTEAIDILGLTPEQIVERGQVDTVRLLIERCRELESALRCYLGSENCSAAEHALEGGHECEAPPDTRMIDWIEKHKAIPLPGNDAESHAWQWVGEATFRERVKQAMGPAEWGKV